MHGSNLHGVLNTFNGHAAAADLRMAARRVEDGSHTLLNAAGCTRHQEHDQRFSCGASCTILPIRCGIYTRSTMR